jgi:hypothetical protein
MSMVTEQRETARIQPTARSALWLALLAAATLTSCSKNPFRGSAACKEEAEQASSWALRLIAEGDGGWFARPDGFEGVLRESPGEWGVEWPHVVLTPSAGTVDGTPAWKPGGDVQELRQILRAKRELFEQLRGADQQLWVHLALDRRLTWKIVAGAIDAIASAGVVGIHLVFDAKSINEAPPKSKRSDQLHAFAKSSGRLVDVGLDPKSKTSVLSDCKSAPSPDEKLSGRENLERLAKALPECGCSVDAAAAREAFWVALRRHQGPPRSFVAIRLAPAGVDATTIELPASLPWSDASAKLLARAQGEKPIRALVIEALTP